MTVYYVRKDGNDTTGNGSTETPYLTINRAINGAAPKIAAGDTLVVGVGTYAEDLSGGAGYFTFPAYASLVTIRGESGAASDVIISGINGTGTLNVYIIYPNIKLQDLTVQGYNGKAVALYVSASNFQATNVVISNVNNIGCRITGAEAISNISFTDCVFSTTGAFQLLFMNPTAGKTITGLTFTRCTALALETNTYAVQIGSAGNNTDLVNVTFNECIIGSARTSSYQSMSINGVTNLELINCSVIQTGGYDNILTTKANGVTITGGLYKASASHALAIGTDEVATANTFQNCVIDGAVIDGTPHAHSLLIGYGGDGAIIRNCTIYGGDYGLVIKHCDGVTATNNNIMGGSAAGLYFKAATNAHVSGGSITTSAGHCVELSYGDANAKSAGCDLTGVTITALGTADIFLWYGDEHDLGGGIVDSNCYKPRTAKKFGLVRADTSVLTIEELRAAWADYDITTNDSHSWVNNPSQLFIRRHGKILVI